MIAQALEHRGFRVHKSMTRVEAWCPDTDRYICGFYWHKATKATDKFPARPAVWRFDIAMSDCYSLKDLKSACIEAKRIRKVVHTCRAAWQKFSGSRSTSRWREYRGEVAALFLRQDT